jgi:hypothetical protein
LFVLGGSGGPWVGSGVGGGGCSAVLGGGTTTVDIVDGVGSGSAVAGIPGLCFLTNASSSSASSPISLSSNSSLSWAMSCGPRGVHASGSLVLIVLVVESVALQAV